jgi:DNA repair and recombination protein RAD52
VDLDDIKFRPVGGGKNAAYVPAEACVGMANEIFTFSRWACEIKEVKLVHCTRGEGAQVGVWSVAYQCHSRVSFLDAAGRPVCWHEDVGYGANQQQKLDMAMESAYKTATTDARKRCLRLFGPALGLDVNSEVFQKAATDARKAQVLAQTAHVAAEARARAAAAAAGGGGGGGGSSSFSAAAGAGGPAPRAAPLQPSPPPPPPPASGAKRPRAGPEEAGSGEGSSSAAPSAGGGGGGGDASATAKETRQAAIEAKRLAALEKQKAKGLAAGGAASAAGGAAS